MAALEGQQQEQGLLHLVSKAGGHDLQDGWQRLPRRWLLQQSSNQGSSSLTAGQIAGIAGAAAGGVLLVGVIIVLVLWLVKRQRRREAVNVKNSSAMLLWSDIELGPEIGQGGFGKVFKGKWQGNRVAVKMLRAEKLDAATLMGLKQEALLQMELAHPFIARVYGLVLEKPNYCLVMHFYRGGTVEEFMNRPRQPGVLCYEDLDIVYRLRMCLQVAKAMMFLHDRRPVPIVHGDLKTANLLMDYQRTDPRTIRVAVADFGLARPILQQKKEVHIKASSSGSVITAHITPPEVIQNPDAPRQRAVDVYAFAICLLEVASGQPAYDLSMAPKLILRNVVRGERPVIPASLPASVADIIKACWAQDPEARPTFHEVVSRLEMTEKLLISSMANRTQYDHTGYL